VDLIKLFVTEFVCVHWVMLTLNWMEFLSFIIRKSDLWKAI
jgi:hypothetical protein